MLTGVPEPQTKSAYQLTRNTLIVSANGNRDGVVWAVQSDGYYVPGGHGPDVLYAYDARNLGRELYNSNQRFARDNPGPASKLNVPTVASLTIYAHSIARCSSCSVKREGGSRRAA